MTTLAAADTREPYLTDKQASDYLRDQYGLNYSCSTLAKWRMRREGPRFDRFGQLVRYKASFLDEFVRTTAVPGIT